VMIIVYDFEEVFDLCKLLLMLHTSDSSWIFLLVIKISLAGFFLLGSKKVGNISFY
jgi:hypothetical protein